MGYNVIFIWECEWERMRDVDDEIKEYLEVIEFYFKFYKFFIDFWEVFFGGRIEVCYLLKDCDLLIECVKVVDFILFYLYVMKYWEFFIGYLVVIRGFFFIFDYFIRVRDIEIWIKWRDFKYWIYLCFYCVERSMSGVEEIVVVGCF